MKILFCAYDAPGLIASGPNAWLQRLIPDLREVYGLDVSVLFIHKNEALLCPTISFFNEHKLPYHTISRSHIPFIEDQVRHLLKLLKEYNYEVLVANLVIPAFYAAKYLKSSKIPVIGVIHSNDAFYDSVIHKFVGGASSMSFDRVITVSQYLKEKTQKLNIHQLPIDVIPCGTPIHKDEIQKEIVGSLNIVYTGRLVDEQKQITKLTKSFIAAAEKDARLNFTIYGSGNKVDAINELINQSSLKNVVYGGAIPPDEIMDKLESQHVFTLMSDYEGMPIALMEAMTCGLVPVCLTEESGINEIISDGVNGFIVNNRFEAYQEKLKFLLNNPVDFERMSKAAISTIAERYSTDVTHKQWADLLYQNKETRIRPLYLPKNIKLDSRLLYYGDKRKPSKKALLLKELKDRGMRLRLIVRPRARMRSILSSLLNYRRKN